MQSEVSKYEGKEIELPQVNGLIISLLRPRKPLPQHPFLAMLILNSTGVGLGANSGASPARLMKEGKSISVLKSQSGFWCRRSDRYTGKLLYMSILKKDY